MQTQLKQEAEYEGLRFQAASEVRKDGSRAELTSEKVLPEQDSSQILSLFTDAFHTAYFLWAFNYSFQYLKPKHCLIK